MELELDELLKPAATPVLEDDDDDDCVTLAPGMPSGAVKPEQSQGVPSCVVTLGVPLEQSQLSPVKVKLNRPWHRLSWPSNSYAAHRKHVKSHQNCSNLSTRNIAVANKQEA